MVSGITSTLRRHWLLCCVAALVVACFAFFLPGCNSKQNLDSPVGSYYLTSLTIDDMDNSTISEDEMESFSLTLRKNRTGVLFIGDGYLELTWDEEYFYDPGGVPKAYTYEDGVLSFQNGSVFMVFQKQDQP